MIAAAALNFMATAIEGAVKAPGGDFKAIKGLTDILNLPWSASWALLVVLEVLGVWLVYLGFRRPSWLQRPETLALRAENPANPRASEDDEEKPAELFHQRPLVFLVGESGADKSSPIRAGSCRPGVLPSTVLPVRVDGWGNDWSDCPIRRASRSPSREQ